MFAVLMQVWDWVKQDLLHTVNDVHECAIVHMEMVPQASFEKGELIVTADQAGVVYTIKIEKAFFRGYKHEKNVIIDGVSTGQVLAMQPLMPLEDSTIMQNMAVIAVCTADPNRVTELGAQTCIARLLPKPEVNCTLHASCY